MKDILEQMRHLCRWLRFVLPLPELHLVHAFNTARPSDLSVEHMLSRCIAEGSRRVRA